MMQREYAESPYLAAAAAGDIRLAVRHEVRRIHESTGGDVRQNLSQGIDRLVNMQLISDDDARALSGLVDQILGAGDGSIPPTEAEQTIHDSYLNLLGQSGASPIAIAIFSLCASGPPAGKMEESGGEAPVAVARVSRSDRADAGMVGGAIAGAAIGGALGGFGGAVIGGVIGGIAGGVGGLCSA